MPTRKSSVAPASCGTTKRTRRSRRESSRSRETRPPSRSRRAEKMTNHTAPWSNTEQEKIKKLFFNRSIPHHCIVGTFHKIEKSAPCRNTGANANFSNAPKIAVSPGPWCDTSLAWCLFLSLKRPFFTLCSIVSYLYIIGNINKYRGPLIETPYIEKTPGSVVQPWSRGTSWTI